MIEPRQSDDRQRVTMFYDGACPVCSKEVAFYRKLDKNRAVRWHDVSADVETLQLHGVTQSDALARLHARLSDGRLVTGVQAFIAVWERIPGFKMLAPIARWTPVRWALEWGYDRYAPRRTRLTAKLARRQT